ncbi:oligosaccharide flippase family protein [Thermodesulfobacteriota bacterium]
MPNDADTKRAQKSYSQILKSSSMVGGAQVITMFARVVQTKFAAILIGPVGIGLIGAYQSIVELTSQFSGLGISQSAVREVAVAAGSNDKSAIECMSSILRRMCWVTGLSGTFVLATLSFHISMLTFGNHEYFLPIIFLSAIILITAITEGKMAVIQGLRRISDLVRIQIIGSIIAVIINVSLYYSLGLSGIVPSLLAVALINLVLSWWFARHVLPPYQLMPWRKTFILAKDLVGLGTALMVRGLSAAFAAYLIRIFIVRYFGMAELGIYQAAFAIPGYVLSFVLGAMVTDFYPRLAGVADDNQKIKQIVNEQTEIGLLLATPAVVATLGMASLVIKILYTADFILSVGMLQWFAVGCFFRVITWPMGYIQLAKGEKYWFMFSQIMFNVLYIFITLLSIYVIGLPGVAMAFCAVCIFHLFVIRLIAKHLANFSWVKDTRKLIFIQVTTVSVVFAATQYFSDNWGIFIGGSVFLLNGIFGIHQILAKLGPEHRISIMINGLRKLLHL